MTSTTSTGEPPRDKPSTPTLALRPAEAARALGIGTRKLWEMTNRGEIPHLKIGRAVVYPVAALEQWLAQQAAKGGRR